MRERMNLYQHVPQHLLLAGIGYVFWPFVTVVRLGWIALSGGNSNPVGHYRGTDNKKWLFW